MSKNFTQRHFRRFFLPLLTILFIFAGLSLSFSLTSTDVTALDAAQLSELKKSDHIYLSDLDYMADSYTRYGNIEKDQNTTKNTIQLRKEGEVVAYARGMAVHADGLLVYDISEFSSDFTHFVADIGVDAAQPAIGTVKLKIKLSDDNKNWQDAPDYTAQDTMLQSTNDCIHVDIDIQGKRYLRFEIDKANGSNANDHFVMGDAMLIKPSYDPSGSLYGEIKKIDDYDTELTAKENYEAAYQDTNTILKREFVNKFGYWSLQNYANVSEDNRNTLNWILQDEDNLKLVIESGEIHNNYKFLDALGKLIKSYSADMDNATDGTVYSTMAVGLASAYSSENLSSPFQFGHITPSYDVVSRFNTVKTLRAEGKLNSHFDDYTVPLMRMVMQDYVRDDEAEWVSYRAHLNNGVYDKTQFNAGAFWLRYISPNYNHPEYFDLANLSQYDATYNLTQNNVPFGTDNNYRLWMAFESGGVCWNTSRTGQAFYRTAGYPATGAYQPAHEAFIYYNPDVGGVWQMNNNVFGWGRTSSTWGGILGYRMLLNWGERDYTNNRVSGNTSGFNVSYVMLAQANIDDYKSYQNTLYYQLLANSYDDDNTKLEIYKKSLETSNYLNIDSYDAIIDIYEKQDAANSEVATASADDKWYELADWVIKNYTYHPGAMYDVLEKEIKPHLTSGSHKAEVDIREREALTAASTAQQADTKQYSEVRAVASVLLGQETAPVATFSFDGENARKIIISDNYDINWQYSLDGGQTWANDKTDAKTVEVPENQLDNITPEHGIEIAIDGTQTHYTIKIEPTPAPNLYANNEEKRLIGADSTMEWRITYTEQAIIDRENDRYEFVEKDCDSGLDCSTWHSYVTESPDLSGFKKIIEVRTKAKDNHAISEEATYEFFDETSAGVDPTFLNNVYVPISMMKIYQVSSQAVERSGAADNLIDGNINTRFITSWDGSDSERYIIVEFERELPISQLKYFAAQDGSAGNVYRLKIFGSNNPESNDWTELAFAKNKQSEYNFSDYQPSNKMNGKDFFIDSEQIAPYKYYKITVEDASGSNGTWFSGSMLKFYRSSTQDPNPTATIEYSTTKPTSGSVTARVTNVFPGYAKVEGNDSCTRTENGECIFTVSYSVPDYDNLDNPDKHYSAQVKATINNIDKDSQDPNLTCSIADQPGNACTLTREAADPDSELDTDYVYKVRTSAKTNSTVHIALDPKEDILILNNSPVSQNEDGTTTDIGTFNLNENGQIVNDRTKRVVNDFLIHDGNIIDPAINAGNNNANLLEKTADVFNYDFSNNEILELKYIDRAGNVGNLAIEVDCIDNIAPEAMVTYSTTTITEDPVTASLTFTDENGDAEDDATVVSVTDARAAESLVENSVENSEITPVATSEQDFFTHTSGTNEVTFHENGKVRIVYRDAAGNLGETEAEVTNIQHNLIQATEGSDLVVGDKKIKNVRPGTTLTELQGQLTSEYGSITFLDSDGTLIDLESDGERPVETGMRASVNGNNYDIILAGDEEKDDDDGDNDDPTEDNPSTGDTPSESEPGTPGGEEEGNNPGDNPGSEGEEGNHSGDAPGGDSGNTPGGSDAPDSGEPGDDGPSTGDTPSTEEGNVPGKDNPSGNTPSTNPSTGSQNENQSTGTEDNLIAQATESGNNATNYDGSSSANNSGSSIGSASSAANQTDSTSITEIISESSTTESTENSENSSETPIESRTITAEDSASDSTDQTSSSEPFSAKNLQEVLPVLIVIVIAFAFFIFFYLRSRKKQN